MIRLPFKTVGILLMIGAAGCGSTGQSRTAGRIEGIKELRASLTKATQQIDTTLSALDGVILTAGGDLRPAYQKFETQLATLDKDADVARSRSDTMRARTKEYFDAWKNEIQAEMTNPEFKKLSVERHAAAEAQFEQVKEVATEAKNAYEKFSADLHQVKKFLDLELNANGVNAAKPIVDKTKESAKGVKDQIMKVAGELDKIISSISPAQGQPAPASAKATP